MGRSQLVPHLEDGLLTNSEMKKNILKGKVVNLIEKDGTIAVGLFIAVHSG